MHPCSDGIDRGLWNPVWNILSDRAFDLILANAAHIKNAPGRKTDMNDAMWIADLLSCGLVRASFVPGQHIQELWSLLRARKQLTREQMSHVQRIQKTLEAPNIKLDSVITDIMGVSGRHRALETHVDGTGRRRPAPVCHSRLAARHCDDIRKLWNRRPVGSANPRSA